jgi:cytochrome P450
MAREQELAALSQTVKPYPLWGVLPQGIDPYELVRPLHEGADVFYAPNSHNSQAGTWVITRFEQIKEVYHDPSSFSAEKQTGIDALLGEPLRMVPTEADAPSHGGYREVLAPLFAPNRLGAIDPGLMAFSRELIGTFSGAGRCEFMAEYAQKFPIGVFLGLMGLPQTDFELLNTWAKALTYSPDFMVKREAIRNITRYLAEKIKEAESQTAQSIISRVVNAGFQGRSLTDEEKLALCLNVFAGGMDTINAALGWQFRYLAMHPDIQAELRADRSKIPAAIEEMLRAFSVVTSSRTALRDIDFHGASIKAGDLVTLATALANRDPSAFKNADQVLLDRSPNRHLAFGYGMHYCMGAALARREMRIAMDTWFDAVPAFRIDGAAEEGLPLFAGNMLSLASLRLAWDA